MSNIAEIFKLFIHLGVVAFGGPAAHIAMLHKEVVDKRKWMNEEHFLDLVGATSLIPGPNSTEMVIHSGFHRGGVLGLFVAGLSFILPACLMSGALAFFYVKLQTLPNFEAYLLGIKPVVIILIYQAIKKLWKKAIKTNELLIVLLLVISLSFTPLGEVAALFVGSFFSFLYFKTKDKIIGSKSISLSAIFFIFLKIGSILFGSGYVLIAYLQDEIVHQRGWLTNTQIADAIAIGQFTPGPVLSTSTFVGYLLGDLNGALLASIGIFLPSFLFVLILNPLIPKMRASKNFSLLLDVVNAASLGLMIYALYPLGKVTFTSINSSLLFALFALISYKFPKLSSIKLVSFAIVSGALFSLIKF